MRVALHVERLGEEGGGLGTQGPDGLVREERLVAANLTEAHAAEGRVEVGGDGGPLLEAPVDEVLEIDDGQPTGEQAILARGLGHRDEQPVGKRTVTFAARQCRCRLAVLILGQGLCAMGK